MTDDEAIEFDEQSALRIALDEKRREIIDRHMEAICPGKVFPDGLDELDSRIQALLSELTVSGYEDENAGWLITCARMHCNLSADAPKPYTPVPITAEQEARITEEWNRIAHHEAAKRVNTSPVWVEFDDLMAEAGQGCLQGRDARWTFLRSSRSTPRTNDRPDLGDVGFCRRRRTECN